MELGLPVTDVSSGLKNNTGVSYPVMTLEKGWRKGTFRSYVKHHLKMNPNLLQVMSSSMVTKINFEGNVAKSKSSIVNKNFYRSL